MLWTVREHESETLPKRPRHGPEARATHCLCTQGSDSKDGDA